MLLDASPSYRLPKSYPVLAIYVHYASIEYSINDRTICLDTPFICFNCCFVCFIRFRPIKWKSKVVPLQHEVTLQSNMIKENVKIMNWRNGFLLSLVSYILYLIIMCGWLSMLPVFWRWITSLRSAWHLCSIFCGMKPATGFLTNWSTWRGLTLLPW